MGDMRRKDRRLTEEETLDVVRRGEYGILSLMGKEGPYGVPLSYVLDEEGKSIYFHGTAAGGEKMNRILENPSVCFTIVTDTEVLPAEFSTRYRSAILYGRATVTEDEEEKKKALLLLVRKYSPDYEEEGIKYIDRAIRAVAIIRMDIQSMTGKGKK